MLNLQILSFVFTFIDLSEKENYKYISLYSAVLLKLGYDEVEYFKIKRATIRNLNPKFHSVFNRLLSKNVELTFENSNIFNYKFISNRIYEKVNIDTNSFCNEYASVSKKCNNVLIKHLVIDFRNSTSNNMLYLLYLNYLIKYVKFNKCSMVIDNNVWEDMIIMLDNYFHSNDLKITIIKK